MAIPDERDQDEKHAAGMTMGMVDDVIDLITDKFIEFDMGGGPSSGGSVTCLYEDDMEPWEWLASAPGGYGGSPSEAKRYFMSNGMAHEADGQVTIQREGVDTSDVWIKRNGPRWKEIRVNFEGIKRPYETVLSFAQSGFVDTELDLASAVDGLVPIAEITDSEVDELSNIDVTESNTDPFSKGIMDRLKGNDTWADARTAADRLAQWRGAGAEMFKWAYLDRLPSILIGQAMTAKALHQSVDILSAAYRNVRAESYTAMRDVEHLVELYPKQERMRAVVDWKAIIKNVAGITGMVASGAALVPGGQKLAVVAGLVSGGLTLGASIAESLGYDLVSSTVIYLEGDAIEVIYRNWYRQVEAFIATVLNSEQVIGDNLSGLRELVDNSRNMDGAQLMSLWNGDVSLTLYESVFAPKAPAEGAFAAASSDGLGAHPPGADDDQPWDVTSTDLQALFKAAVEHVPAVADAYGGFARLGADAGMAAATQRTGYETVPAGGPTYAVEGHGAALQPWLDLYAAFDEMMTTSETNFRAAAAGLKAAAIKYREADDSAAAGIDDLYREIE